MHKNRALVLIGAGASLEFGAPSTTDLTNYIEQKTLNDDWMQFNSGYQAWIEIKHTLSRYFDNDAYNTNSCQTVTVTQLLLKAMGIVT